MNARNLHIQEVLSILRGIPEPRFEPGHVRSLLEGVTVETSSLEPYLHFQKGRYTRNLIHRDQIFELLALCWDGGTSSPVHNHSGQDCWFLVQEGQFCLEGYRLAGGGTCPGDARLEHVESTHKISPGALDHRGRGSAVGMDIHQVKVSRGNPRAVSLHVYARPFDECLVYDVKNNRCQKQRLTYHSIEGRVGATS